MGGLGTRGDGAIEALVVIGGSTASGKSALALSVARAIGGVVVNADSQQLYRDLPTLSARPTPAEEAAVPHRLYGVLDPAEQASLGRWLALVEPVLAAARHSRQPIVLTGGSGLYIEALLEGVSPMPAVPAELREALRVETEGASTPDLHARLHGLDPLTAARLRPTDRQRILRALEVVIATGRPLAAWQALPRRRLPLPERRAGLALLPPAAIVDPRIRQRLRQMLEGGAVEEVRALSARQPDLAGLPIAKLHGCRELLAVAGGRLDLAAAEAATALQVRQYAKRQRTFFRHRLSGLPAFAGLGSEPAALAAILGRLASD